MTKRSRPARPKSDDAAGIRSWLLDQALFGASQEDLLEGYCSRLAASGLPVQKVHVAQRALHPVFGAIGFDWHRDAGIMRELFAHAATPTERWASSPFYHMISQGIDEMRVPLTDRGKPHRFPVLDEFRADGATDYFAIVLPFTEPAAGRRFDPNDAPEGMVISWVGDAPDGFSDSDIEILRGLMPALGLALKSTSNRQMAEDLLAAYLGRDAGARVMSGELQRGALETIHAVIWYFDLQQFTSLSETRSGEAIISMLNDYFEAVVSVVEDHGGNVLKFMGDGLLAIFAAAELPDGCRSAITAATALRPLFADVSTRRKAAGLPVTGYTLALHAGDVLYGNIGAEHRLDFTVIGPAVNATARILGMCRSLEQDLIISSKVVEPLMAQRDDIVSLGRYMLRGVPAPQELFTLHAGKQQGL